MRMAVHSRRDKRCDALRRPALDAGGWQLSFCMKDRR